MKRNVIQIRMESDEDIKLKVKAEKRFNKLGLSLSQGIRRLLEEFINSQTRGMG